MLSIEKCLFDFMGLWPFNKKPIEYNREYFLTKADQLVREQLMEQVDKVLDLQRMVSLKSSEILSDSIAKSNSKTIPKRIKAFVSGNSVIVRKIIEGVALEIKRNEFKTIDQVVNKMDLAKIDQIRITKFFDAQKSFNLSFNSLKLTIDIFMDLNNKILEELSNSSDAAKNIRFRLQNAILVYELTSFVVEYIEKFELTGIDNIIAVKKEVFDDLDANSQLDSDIRASIERASDISTKESTLRDLENRKELRQSIKVQWDSFVDRINTAKSQVSSVKGFLNDLKLTRDNARSQIDILGLFAMTRLMKENISCIERISELRNMQLAPLTPVEACGLLNISIDSEYQSTTLDSSQTLQSIE